MVFNVWQYFLTHFLTHDSLYKILSVFHSLMTVAHETAQVTVIQKKSITFVRNRDVIWQGWNRLSYHLAYTGVNNFYFKEQPILKFSMETRIININFFTDLKFCSYWCDGWRTTSKLWLCRHRGSLCLSDLVEPTAGCSMIKSMWPVCSNVLQGWHLLHSCGAPRQYGFTTWLKSPRRGKAEEILFLLSPTLDWAGSSTRLG